MKTRKPLEPILPGVTDFRPRLARFGNGSDLPALAAIKKAIGTTTRRSKCKRWLERIRSHKTTKRISAKGGG